MITERILTAFLRVEMPKHLNIGKTSLQNLPHAMPDKRYMLYMHIPFCEVLCPYCSFNRFVYQEDIAKAYFSQLREEMRMVADLGYSFPSMYIGGGTPTVQMDELVKTIDLANELFDLEEVSCETNPNHLTPEILSDLQGRVQRLSVGVQSFDNQLLKQMQRYEKYGSGEEILERLQEISAENLFPTLNVDMIFNFPSQTKEILLADTQKLVASGVNQTTFYPLMTSPAVERTMKRTVGAVSHQNEVYFYELINKGLSSAFNPISAWCFSRDPESMIDEYIVDYKEYAGIGSGSFSYLNGDLYVNTFSLREYTNKIKSGIMSVSGIKNYKLREQMRYYFMMELFGLRLDKLKFKKVFGKSIDTALWLEMTFMKIAGAFEKNTDKEITLNPQGRYLLLVMMREFFSTMDNVREEARNSLSSDEKEELLGDFLKAPVIGPE
ncbi:MAG: coproporphyrinogen III oxidase family protein [Anaerolineaceae bacterium]|nr:coproporphyrinogen III oxidase family protein [Anaerolineaceae bacterium]